MNQIGNDIDTGAEATVVSQKARPAVVRFAPLIVIALFVVLAVAVLSRPAPGRRTSTDTSTTVLVSVSEPVESVEYPISLLEGGDAGHEADHIFQPLIGVDGIASAELDWSSGVVLTVKFDPAEISAQEVASIVMSSGYLSPPPTP